MQLTSIAQPAVPITPQQPAVANSGTPIQMTRAQYQQTYGTPPSLPAKPVILPQSAAPIRMTRAQYQQTYGSAPNVPTDPLASVKSVLQGYDNFSNDISSARDQIGNNFKAAYDSLTTPAVNQNDPSNLLTPRQALDSGLNIADKVTTALASVFSAPISAVLTPIIQKSADFITSNPSIVHGLNAVNNVIDKYPQAATEIGNAFNTFMNVAGLTTGEEAVKTGSSPLIDTTAKIVAEVPPTPPADIGSMIQEPGQVTPEKAQQSAWNDIKPKSTAGTDLAYAKAGNTTPQGLLGPGKILPSPADQRLIDVQSQLYENGTIDDSMSPNEKQVAIKQKASQLNDDQTNFLKDHDKAVTLTGTDIKGNPVGIFDKLDSVSQEATLPFARDTSLKAAYDSIIDVFKSKLQTGSGAGTTAGATTLSKISQALTSFDAAMDKFGAYKKTATGELTDTAQIRQNAIRDVHETVRDYISDNLPANSPWKSIRDQESRLYDISDRLSQRIVEGMQNGKILQTIKNNPIIEKGLETAGLGTALKVLK